MPRNGRSAREAFHGAGLVGGVGGMVRGGLRAAKSQLLILYAKIEVCRNVVRRVNEYLG